TQADLVRRFEQAITPATKVIHFCHITNLTGHIFPAKEICDLARRRGILTIVDGAHADRGRPGTRHAQSVDARASIVRCPRVSSSLPGGAAETARSTAQGAIPAMSGARSSRFVRALSRARRVARARRTLPSPGAPLICHAPRHRRPMPGVTTVDRVRGSRIVVRRAKQGEPFTTLDGTARSLDADDLVICDGEGPSALAGVMGGQDSEIRQSTKRVLLECAYFTPRGVRRTSRRHGLHTESSFRFERGVDWGGVPRVLEIAKGLLSDLAGGAVVSGAIHAKGPDPELPVVRLRSARLNALLGVEVPFAEATNILRRLGLEVIRDGSSEAEVRGASWRPDISREADLIEEVARVRGLDLVPTKIPAIAPQPPRISGKLERTAAAHATSLGLSEALTYAFVSPSELDAVKAPAPVVRIRNPLSEERTVMRTSLLPGLLDALRRARRHGEEAVRLFAIGARFLPPGQETRSVARPRRPEDARDLPAERPSFAAVLAGPRPTYLAVPGEVDVFDAKGIALEMAERLTGRTAKARLATGTPGTAHLHPRGTGEVLVEGERVGIFGPLHPDVADAFDLGGEAFVVELDLAALEAQGERTPRYRPIPRLPPVTRDVALVVSDDVSAEQVEGVIREAAGELCESVQLFDMFRGGSVPEGHRSLAFHLVYRDPKAAAEPEKARTLTDREVDQRHAEVVKAATERLGGQLRA
ncbi:MAG: aminotransferase class V-fold PLP-dependent enzyme, partial [Sorangiineae bacterium PRO1]|nr:aminotransferase class V-fold PLP-dependent enzyme [Sorangiineae bacterium PRO1]